MCNKGSECRAFTLVYFLATLLIIIIPSNCQEDMGEFFLPPPPVSNHETFFFGKDIFQLVRKKNFFFEHRPCQGRLRANFWKKI